MKILGMGVPELVIILVMILLIFGPKNLPKLGAALGSTVKSFRKGIESDEKEDHDIDDIEEDVSEAPVKATKSLEGEVSQPKKKKAKRKAAPNKEVA